MAQSLSGKTALITGAGKGIGKAISLALAAEGVNLVLISRTLEDLKQVAQQATTLNKSIKVNYATVNVADYAEVKSTIASLKAAAGPIDILINNAGIVRTGTILDMDVAEWESVIQINVLGAYYVTHEVVPQMVERKQGDVVNIASTAGLKGNANMSAYGASKAALINFSEALMQEVRKSNVRVMTVNPSTIATEMVIQIKFTDGNPERVLQPEDLAELIVANLKLSNRAFVKEVGLWSTNPV